MLKWIHNNGAMNLSVVITYSIVDLLFAAFSSSLRPFDPKRNVFTIVESFLSNRECLMLLTFFDLSNLSGEKEVDCCFNIPTAVAKLV